MRKALPLLACLFSVGPAGAQVRPFVFTVTTSGAAAGPDSRPWTAFYDAGYGERTAEPFGYDGVEQRFGLQGRLGAGFTLLGHVAFGIGDDATRSSQEAEVLKDVLGSTSSMRLAVGLGARREWQGTTAALARVCLGWSARRTLLFGNLRLEKPFAEGRDSVDLITTLGWLQGVGSGLRIGVEAVGEDLEGFWEAEEAEGGAKLYAGPSLHWSAPTGRLWLSASGGPILYATRSGRTSPAPRPLDASGNGFTLRVSLGYTF
ncbi:MAG TPA: hypothetical protein VL691_00515 [Vicinamibacteria bacterium]|nr:hypothetical protein [Vicinamibacteria bacterium]